MPDSQPPPLRVGRALLAVVTAAIGMACVDLMADEPKSAVQKQTLSELKESFKYDPTIAEAEKREPLPGDLLVLPRMEVKGDAESLDRSKGKLAQPKIPEKFDWRQGGTFLPRKGLRPEVKFKYNPAHKGFDILNYGW